MSNTVKITYSELSNAIGKLRQASGECDDYARALNRREVSNLNNYTGNDPNGYVGSANAMVLNKIRLLDSKRDKLKNAAQKLADFKESVSYHDQRVGDHAKQIMEKYIGKRNAFQQIGDFLYGTFCVDLVNNNPITKFFGDLFKSGFDTIQNISVKVIDWFKHGGGKYVLNIVAGIVGAVAAVAGVVIAIITFPVTGTVAAIVLATVAIVAGVVAAGITIFNTYHQVKNNKKALDKYNEGDDGQARFYGDISSFSDATKKTDYGGKTENDEMEHRGRVVDDVKIAADVIGFAAGTASKLGKVETINLDGSKSISLDFSKKNLLENIKKSMGWVKNPKTEKLEFSWKEAFKSSITKKETQEANVTDWLHKSNVVVKKTDAVVKKIKALDTFTNKTKDAKGVYKKTKAGLDIFLDHKLFDPINNLIKVINFGYSLGDVHLY